LYFSSGNNLYKRNDGLSPSYSIARDFSDHSTNVNCAIGGIRGLTTIANPNNNNDALLLMWCPDGQSQGTIYRLELMDLVDLTTFMKLKYHCWLRAICQAQM